MRKQILLIMILCLSATMVWAERIDVSTARKVAENVANAGSGLRSAGDLSLVYAAVPGQSGSTLRSGTVNGDADYFVFNVGSENGFVIIAGDDRVRPVLGYADEGSFDAGKLPPNAAAWLAGYQEDISEAISKGIQPSVAIQQEWNKYLNGRSRLRSAPVLLKTPSWGQGEPYNQACPDVAQGKAVTGCVATAMAIVMKYHGAPTEASSTNRRTDFNGLTVTYAPYQWSNMLDTYSGGTYTDAQADAVAQLMWHCGINVSMKYGLNESSAYMADAVNAMTDVFNYPTTRIVYPESRTVNEWEGLLRAELDAKRPVLYEVGRIPKGHVFVFDGYDSDGRYHANWGWNGLANGYYPLYILDPDNDGNLYNVRSMAIGIKPGSGESADKNTLRLTQSLKEGSSSTYYLMIDAFFMNESTKPFKGLINIAKVNVGTKAVQKILAENATVELVGAEYYAPYTTWNIEKKGNISDGEHVAAVYSLDDGRTWQILEGGEGVRWYVEVGKYASNTGEVDFSVMETKDGFADRYLGAGIENEGVMEYTSIYSPEACFRYKLKTDPPQGLKMSYKSYDNYLANEPAAYTALSFDDKGEAWTQPTRFYESYGFSSVRMLHKLNIETEKEGFLNYEVSVYDKDKKTLLARFDKSLRLVKPVPLTVTPIKGLFDKEIPFSFSIGNDIDEVLKYKNVNVNIRLVGDNLSEAFIPDIVYKGSSDYRLQMLEEDFKMGTETVTSYVGHIGSRIHLGEGTYSFTFKLNGTFSGKVFVELAAAETEGIFTVLDKIATTGSMTEVEIVSSDVRVNFHNNPYSSRYIIPDKDDFGEGKPMRIQIDGLEESAGVMAEIKLKNPAWGNASVWSYSLDKPVYVSGSGSKLSFDEGGSAWIPVTNEKIKDNMLSLYLNLKLTSKATEALEYEVTLWDSEKKVAYATSRVYSMTVIEKQLTWVFTPTEVTGTADQEFPFTVKAKNVDQILSGLPASISLNIEGSLRDEVEVDYIDETGNRVPLNMIVHPDYPSANLCVTEANEVPNLEEDKEYKFVFRYIGGFAAGLDEMGDIQVESLRLDPNLTASYNMSVPFEPNGKMVYRISENASSSVTISGEIPYESAHTGKNVIVSSDGIYVINMENASINSLTIEDGGQVKLKKQLTVTEKPRIKRNIPTDQWTTVTMPLDTWVLIDPAELAVKKGYTGPKEQEWAPVTTSGNPARYAVSGHSAYLFAAANTPQVVTFEQTASAIATLPALQDGTAAPGNVENGNWFQFKANPYWENLMINGRAYVLDGSKNSFELRQAPVIPPFQAYMVASEAMMNKISSLRLGDVPTSVEDIQPTGFRTWTEGRTLCFETTEATDIEIYSLNGVRQGRYERSVGTKRVNLPQGTYLVVCDGTAIKVVI